MTIKDKVHQPFRDEFLRSRHATRLWNAPLGWTLPPLAVIVGVMLLIGCPYWSLGIPTALAAVWGAWLYRRERLRQIVTLTIDGLLQRDVQ